MKHLSPFIATHKRSTRKRGQALVEFALVLPVLLLFIMGTIDFGRALFTYAQASSQLRQALRLAAVIGYDSAPVKPYLDCDRMRETARSVYFANQPIPMEIMYLRAVSGPAWSDTTQSFTEPTAAPELCPETSGTDIGPTPPTYPPLQNGDILRIRETVSIAMITPLFPQTLTFTLQGQRTVITHITLSSVEYCGDLICQPGVGEDSTTCAEDCPAEPGNNAPAITSVAPACNASITTPYTITIKASDPDVGDEPVNLHVYAVINGADTSVPYSGSGTTYTLSWNPGTVGTYSFQAKVVDNATPPHTTTSTLCNVTVTGTGSSNTAPVIDSIIPANASPLALTAVKIYAHDAETGAGLLNVAVTMTAGAPLSGTAAWNASGGYYEFAWATPASGPVTINVTVKDTGTPQLSTPGSQLVNIAACGGNCPPGPVTITSPFGGSTVAGSVPIQISAPDGETLPNMMAVQVSVDNGATWLPGLATWTGSGYTYIYTWNTTLPDNGSHAIVAKATDELGLSTLSPAVNVTVNNGANTPPVLDGITTDAGLSVKHDSLRQIRVTAHDAETGAGLLTVTVTVSGGTLNPVSGVATWNSGLGAYVIDWTVPASGPVTINATVQDTGSPPLSATNSATATVLVPTTMHVNALAITYTWDGVSSDWVGFVTITVVDNLGDPVPGVTVTGNWMAGVPSRTGRDFCLVPTNASGQCTIQITGIPTNKSLTFTMLADFGFSDGTITGGTLTYAAGGNVVNTVTWGPPTVKYP